MQTSGATLADACIRGDLEEIHRLLQTGYDVARHATTCLDDDQTAPLMLAVDQGHSDVVRCLLHAGADPRLVPAALAVACWEGNAEIVGDLLRAGAPPDSEDTTGALPLHISATLGHTGIVRALLARGARADSEDGFGHTALHKAAFGGHVGAVEALLAAGAGNAEPSARDTPLHAACERGHLPIVSLLLLSHNNNVHTPDSDGETPLHRACHGGHLGIVRHLVEAGADLDAVTSDGWTPLHMAADCRCTLSIGALLDKIEEDRIDKAGVEDFNCYCSHTAHDAPGVVRFLLDCGAAVNVTDNNRLTPLHLASRLYDVTVVEMLLQAGACVNAPNKYLESPLHFACEHARPEVARSLVEYGADLGSVTFYTATPLDLAFHKYNSGERMLKTLHFLLTQGCPLLANSRININSSSLAKFVLMLWAGGFTGHVVLGKVMTFALEGDLDLFRFLVTAQPQKFKKKQYHQMFQQFLTRGRDDVGDDVIIADDDVEFRQEVAQEICAPSALYRLAIGATRDHIISVSNGNSIIPRVDLLTGIISRCISDDLLLLAHMRCVIPQIFNC